MTAIGSIGGATAPITAPPARTQPASPVQAVGGVAAPATGEDDALAPMRAAMDTAFAIGRPTDTTQAAAILDTGDDFLAGAQQAIGKLDAQLQERSERLAAGTGGPAQQAEDREQIALMQVLRDRIQQSVDRMTELLADDERLSEVTRASVLAPIPHPVDVTTAIDPSLVAGAYARGGFGEASLAAGG